MILGGVLVASAALVFLGDQYFTAAVENQNARNDFLRKEIVVLDARIKEISELKSRRQQLLERMKIIQDLQGNVPSSDGCSTSSCGPCPTACISPT